MIVLEGSVVENLITHCAKVAIEVGCNSIALLLCNCQKRLPRVIAYLNIPFLDEPLSKIASFLCGRFEQRVESVVDKKLMM